MFIVIFSLNKFDVEEVEGGRVGRMVLEEWHESLQLDLLELRFLLHLQDIIKVARSHLVRLYHHVNYNKNIQVQSHTAAESRRLHAPIAIFHGKLHAVSENVTIHQECRKHIF